MPDGTIKILLDQNVPAAAGAWLRDHRPEWEVYHTNELGFAGQSDVFLYRWAQENRATIVTFDEDFADARLRGGKPPSPGVIRLRVWPTTLEATIEALSRLLSGVPEDQWEGALVIIDNQKIRVRRM